jgi:hypothetical protein
MQYRSSACVYDLGDRKPLEKLDRHLNEWARAGWRLVSDAVIVTGADEDGREHHLIWERD